MTSHPDKQQSNDSSQPSVHANASGPSPEGSHEPQLYETKPSPVQRPPQQKQPGLIARFRAQPWLTKLLIVVFLPLVLAFVLIEALEEFFIPAKTRNSGWFGFTQIAVGAVLAALFINTFVFQSYQVVGSSMEPTLTNGDRLIVNKIGKSWDRLWQRDHLPKRGQIIIFDSPQAPDKQLVKRVIGLPGDTVVIDRGDITIFNDANPDGFDPDESYEDSLVVDVNYTLTRDVVEGTIFVAGDNRIGGASSDSRNDLGLVPLDNVIGELVLRLLPLSESRFF